MPTMYPIYPSFLEKDQLDPYAYYDDYGNRFLVMDLYELNLINKMLFMKLLFKNR